MLEAKQKPKLPHEKMTTEWAQFYQALGTLNTNIVARVMQDPNAIKDITKNIIVWCVVHDAECGDGFVYDHIGNRCLMLVKPTGD